MSHTNLTVYGATWCSDCKRAKKFLGEQRVHYNWVDVEQNADGLALVERVNRGKRIIPTIVFDDGSMMVEPNTLGEQTTWSPAFSSPIPSSRIAAMPLEVAMHASVPSSAARRRSNIGTVGLVKRE